MRKILALAFLFAAALPASAADNTLLVTPCAAGCITTKSKDVGAGVQAPQPVLSDASGNALAMPTAGADGVSNTATGLQGYNYPFWFNGTTWDRARGDATNGAFVNVKTSVLPTGAATAAKQDTMISALTGALPAGGNSIGLVKVDQSTFGTTNGVVNAANTYNTIAASQTAQVMSAVQAGGTGAAGDFLSHCVVTPGTTSPGVVTVLDNATAIISFAGGASSVSNLVPFALPVAAKSTSGAWKITTGANVTVACVGKFS